MYAKEDEAKNMDAEQSLAHRKQHLEPLFDQFERWLESYRHQVIPKGKFAAAIQYGLNHWPETKATLRDGRVELDNNGIENHVRPLALERKNFLFAGSHTSAQYIAVLYSLITSCKALDINAREYLLDTLHKINNWPQKRIAELLPKPKISA